MKMIYIGTLAKQPDRDWNWINAFEKLGCLVIPFCTQSDIAAKGLINRVFRRLNIGRDNYQLEKKLLSLAQRERPDWMHFRLPLNFSRNTIEEIKKLNIIVTDYFNDDPFSKRAPLGLYCKFRSALVMYDAHFVYRAHNVERYQKAGATYVEHTPPTYDPSRHVRSILSSSSCFLADAAFIGHWENDCRTDYLEALVKNGFSVIIKGGMWDKALRNKLLGKLVPVSHAFGIEYNHIYANVVAGLCFFSKINNDTWTERALEIIAVGGVLVCERNAEAQSYFIDREEACFFSSILELLDIVGRLKKDSIYRAKVRDAGYARLLAGKNTISDRARQVYNYVENRIILTKDAHLIG